LFRQQQPNLGTEDVAASLAICLYSPSDRTVASGVVGVGNYNHSQMRTSKCTCVIFGVSIGLDLS